MRILKSLAAASCAAVAAVMFLTAAPVQAQEPHYLHALSDLRTARDYINFDKRDMYRNERKQANEEIDAAIAEIKHAAWDDGKNTRFAPPSGVIDPWMPLHSALDALHKSHQSVEAGVDTPENTGLRSRALQHIEHAESIVSRVITYQHQ
jgi:hypothetical protein